LPEVNIKMSIILNSVVENHSLPSGEELPPETSKVTFKAVDRKVTFSGHFLVEVNGAVYLVSGSGIDPYESDFMIRFNGGRGEGITNVSLVLREEDESDGDLELVYEGYVVDPLYSINYTENGGYYGSWDKKVVGHITSTLREVLRNLEEGKSSVDPEELFSLDDCKPVPYGEFTDK
jgi:hypothetical protein